jgi:two-component system, OmpR family, sensor histidine kinase YxdK
MSFMQLIINVIQDKKVIIFVYIINTFLIVSFYMLLLGSEELLYPILLSGVLFILYLGYEMYTYHKFTNDIEDGRKSPNYTTHSMNNKDKLVFTTLSKVHQEYNRKFYDNKVKQNQKNSLFSQWIHNMKTSVSVIHLACEISLSERENDEYMEDIKEENDILKKNLDEALNLLRIEEFSSDFIAQRLPLKQLVYQALNERRREMRYKGIHPLVNIPDELEILTDKKWAQYMLEQILSNAIKYSIVEKSESIIIRATEEGDNLILSVRDEGIGIDEKDINRVFEPFFTGEGGRRDRNATGIGLYMVKLISDRLGHKIQIQSQKDKGTTVQITFLSKL